MDCFRLVRRDSVVKTMLRLKRQSTRFSVANTIIATTASLLLLTAVVVTSAEVRLVPSAAVADEYCQLSLYCWFNASDVVEVQLQMNASSSDWQTGDVSNSTADNETNWVERFAEPFDGNTTTGNVTFSIAATKLTDAGLYRCVVTDLSGDQWDHSVHVLINESTASCANVTCPADEQCSLMCGGTQCITMATNVTSTRYSSRASSSAAPAVPSSTRRPVNTNCDNVKKFESSTLEVVLGDTLSINCVAKSSPASVSWTRDSTVVAEESKLQVLSVRLSDAGSYTCTVSDSTCTSTTAISVTVTFDVPPTTSTAVEMEKKEGEPLQLTCNLTTTPVPFLYWIHQLPSDDEEEAPTTAADELVTSLAVVRSVARDGSVVGNASFGQAMVYAESISGSGFAGTYTCFALFNDSTLPLYTILQYSLTVVSDHVVQQSDGDNSLPTWAIALIVVGAVVIIAAVIIFICCFKLKCCCFNNDKGDEGEDGDEDEETPSSSFCSCCCCCNNEVSPNKEGDTESVCSEETAGPPRNSRVTQEAETSDGRRRLPAGGRLPPLERKPNGVGKTLKRYEEIEDCDDDDDDDDDDEEDEEDVRSRKRPSSAVGKRRVPPLPMDDLGDREEERKQRRRTATSSN